MNIFWLDKDLEKCVEYYMDKHVVKMITEYAQLLSSSSRLVDFPQGYKLTHAKHPCTLWVLQSTDNWLLLHNLTCKLHEEYQYRYGKHKIHKSYEMILTLNAPPLPKIGLTTPPLCMPDKYKCNNIIESYRNYYIGDKQHIAHWTGRNTPMWYKPMHT